MYIPWTQDTPKGALKVYGNLKIIQLKPDDNKIIITLWCISSCYIISK